MLADSAHWGQVVGGVGTGIGAIAAAIGAIAAGRAASASRDTSRDALEARAVGNRPRPHTGYRQRPLRPDEPMPAKRTRLLLRVVNVSEWPASDLALEATLSDGQRVSEQTERLAGGGDQ